MALGEALPLSVAAGAPWLAEARDRVLRMVAADRLSHALLLQGPPGIGKQALAEWIARLALCDSPQEGPCGQCPSCVQHSAGSHPDLQRVVIPEDKKQIVTHLRRLSMVSPYLAVMVMPGSFIVLPALAWWLDRRRQNNLRKNLPPGSSPA